MCPACLAAIVVAAASSGGAWALKRNAKGVIGMKKSSKEVKHDFKKAKARRQIILITHNPNLVVNADSEQVIVATCARRADNLPHISYESGSLENVTPDGKGIRQQVCRILEGGADAFLKREKRYSLSET